MKKTYKNPEIEIVVLNTNCQILAGSDMSARGDYDSNDVNIGARSFGFIDDDAE